jgi:hypothetical protein
MGRPLEGAARDLFPAVVEDRLVVVAGYSGLDRDTFPLFIHAAEHWGTELAWILYDEASRNERVAALQVTLGRRCMVIDAGRRAVLAELAGIPPEDGHQRQRPSVEHLARGFDSYLKPHPTERLIAALIASIVPADVEDGEALAARLAEILLLVDGMPPVSPRPSSTTSGRPLRIWPQGLVAPPPSSSDWT